MEWGFNKYEKNCLVYTWFVYKLVIYFFYKVLALGINRIQIVLGFELEIDVIRINVYPVIFFLKQHTMCQCNSLIDIICYDNPNFNYRFTIVYNLLSTYTNLRLRVITKILELSHVISLVGLFYSVNWYEREAYDFFGIYFVLHNDLRRILTDYGFKGYPLRKDFPIAGFIDVYYNDMYKRICYRPLELNQEYRNFKLLNMWN